MNNEIVAAIAAQALDNIEHKMNDLDDTRLCDPKHFNEEFARLLIKECIDLVKNFYNEDDPWIAVSAATTIENYFGMS